MDVFFIDRNLHMLGEPERHSVLVRLLDHVDHEGFVLIADEPSNMAGMTW